MGTKKTVFLSLFVLAVAPVQAHYIWLERDAQGANVRFGEYEEGLYERSPGRLDDIGRPSLRRDDAVISGGQLSSDGWRFAVVPGGRLVAESLEHPVRDWRKYGVGIVKPFFYTRHASGTAAVAPELPLDVTPTGQVGEFLVSYENKPLAESKVVFYAPNGWSREGKTDPAGKVRFDLPWKGTYILEATHQVAAPGTFKGAAYESVRHRATLAYEHSGGEPTFRPQATQQ